VAGCATAAPPSSSAPDGSDAPLPAVPGLDPEDVGLTCGGGDTAFHPSLLIAPGHAEAEPDGAAAALRREIASGARIPATGWIRVAQTADFAQFVAQEVDQGDWWEAAFSLEAGSWRASSHGVCQLQPLVPVGVSIAAWRLDPSFPGPAAGDRTIHALINERACAGGRPPDGRVLPPAITVSADRITITVLVRSLPGGNDCPGNPDFPVEIELTEPLGARSLFDGGVFPPAGPLTSYELACGPVEPVVCSARGAEAVRDAEGRPGGPRVVSVTFLDEAGSYSLLMDDGSGVTMVVN
jgi:hypothetical protein